MLSIKIVKDEYCTEGTFEGIYSIDKEIHTSDVFNLRIHSYNLGDLTVFGSSKDDVINKLKTGVQELIDEYEALLNNIDNGIVEINIKEF